MTRDDVGGFDTPRTIALLLCAWTWTLLGLAVLLGTAGSSPYVWHTSLPVWFRVGLWFVPAGFAVYTCLTRRMAGWTIALLVLAPTIRIVSYLTGWVAYLVGGPGAPFGWYSASLHLAPFGLVVLTAYLTRDDDRAGA